jgi:hypothetical protein
MATSNTLNGLSLTVIAQESLKALLPKMPLIGAFTTDFSSDVQAVGAAVSTRVPSALTAQATATVGYSGLNATSTAKTITLDQWPNVTVGFNDKEVSTISLGMLQKTFIGPLVNGIVSNVMSGVLANVTTGNFPATLTGLTTANFNAAKIGDAVTTLNTNNAPDSQRNVMLTPSYYGALGKDTSLALAYAYGGSEVIRENKIPHVYGANILYYNNIPAGQANEGKVGFVCSPDALLIASRPPAIPANFPGDIVNVTDPDSQFTLQLRTWYDANNGVTNIAGTVLFGTAVGNSGSLVRAVTGVI